MGHPTPDSPVFHNTLDSTVPRRKWVMVKPAPPRQRVMNP